MGENEMVERVAKAIRKVNTETVGLTFTELSEAMARAAIEAMREPTAGQRQRYYELSGRTEVMFDAHWERAIDAALSLEEGE